MSARIEQGLWGRWILVHPTKPQLAWSGAQWVPHDRGIPTGGVQVSNYATKAEAEVARAVIDDVLPTVPSRHVHES